jgi:hypothetical protein
MPQKISTKSSIAKANIDDELNDEDMEACVKDVEMTEDTKVD